ncbi:hypothetical protein EYB26_005655 [Talaromyces marneffei]|uniref:uncharacterized protein n=1 Tax=Talaromyces marneffei TaxID=37727 RepID=UPI0012AA5C21|nr:uncharacterized protein EYB26_005655 [Talaromyces marneffei]QGA17977.1 hypothetical protein EYB26_005655 [Talaromyces marneffei]
MRFFKPRTSKASAVPTGPTAPVEPATSEANFGTSEPRILGNREAYSRRLIDKGELFIIKYDGNDEVSRRMNLILQESIILPVDRNSVRKSNDPKKTALGRRRAHDR